MFKIKKYVKFVCLTLYKWYTNIDIDKQKNIFFLFISLESKKQMHIYDEVKENDKVMLHTPQANSCWHVPTTPCHICRPNAGLFLPEMMMMMRFLKPTLNMIK